MWTKPAKKDRLSHVSQAARFLNEVEMEVDACTTRVRKTEVLTTPVRSQQCERVNSANETRVRMSNVRMPPVRCDIGAKRCDSSANGNSAKRTLCRDMHALLYRKKPEFWDRQIHFFPLI